MTYEDLKAAAESLWNQGLRASDRTIIELQYGYTEPELTAICDLLGERERLGFYLEV